MHRTPSKFYDALRFVAPSILQRYEANLEATCPANSGSTLMLLENPSWVLRSWRKAVFGLFDFEFHQLSGVRLDEVDDDHLYANALPVCVVLSILFLLSNLTRLDSFLSTIWTKYCVRPKIYDVKLEAPVRRLASVSSLYMRDMYFE